MKKNFKIKACCQLEGFLSIGTLVIPYLKAACAIGNKMLGMLHAQPPGDQLVTTITCNCSPNVNVKKKKKFNAITTQLLIFSSLKKVSNLNSSIIEP